MKQVALQIFSIAVNAAGVPELSNEAASIAIWCLTQNPDCYKLWGKIYLDNVKASVTVLKKLSDEWKEHSVKHASLDPMRETVRSFKQKNEKALAEAEVAGQQASLRAADKYCKIILGRLSRGHGCLKSLVAVAAAVGAGAFFISPKMESFSWNNLVELFNSYNFF